MGYQRYELQRRSTGGCWGLERDGDSVQSLKPHAQCWVDEWRLIDLKREMVRGLDVTPTECLLADDGWKPVDLMRCHGCSMAMASDEANFSNRYPWCDGCYKDEE